MGLFGTNRYQLRVPWTREPAPDTEHLNENFRLLDEWARNIVATHLVPPGSILFWGNVAPPDGWLLCDGSLYDRKAYADLYGVCGITFGTTTASNFRVPDLQGRFPLGTGTGAGLTARTLGATGGAETHTLTSGESGLVSHNHTQDAHLHTAVSHTHTQNAHHHDSGNGASFYWASGFGTFGTTLFGGTDSYTTLNTSDVAAVNQNAAPPTNNATATNQAVAAANATTAFNIMQPFLVLTGIIKI